MIYAGIGSRKTPPHILSMMSSIGYSLADRWTLRSGRAKGADQAFEFGCMQYAQETGREPNMEIFLPYNGFGNVFRSKHYILLEWSKQLEDIAAQFHPAWDRCTEMAKMFHMRNVWQIAGKDLSTPADMVICWTENGGMNGGTAQAMRIAEYLKIPVFNLGLANIEGIQEQLTNFVAEKENNDTQ
jgi:hypothetical protein